MAKSKPAKSAAKAKKSTPAKAVKSAKKPAVKAATITKKPVPKAAKSAKKPAAKVVKTKTKPEPKAASKPVAKAPAKVNGSAKAPVHHEVPDNVANSRLPAKPVVMTTFLIKQKERLLQLRDSMLDSMMGVAKDNLRTRAEGSEASAFGMHQADAGSDAYDRDFALSLLSQEQDALYEIEEAIKRIDLGTYGICEMSGKPIAHPRLEALPFARYTVECQSQIEKQGKVTRARVPVTSLFGLTDEEPGETEEEETVSEPKE
jgi:RNA polymerase-binding transcription factor DksA